MQVVARFKTRHACKTLFPSLITTSAQKPKAARNKLSLNCFFILKAELHTTSDVNKVMAINTSSCASRCTEYAVDKQCQCRGSGWTSPVKSGNIVRIHMICQYGPLFFYNKLHECSGRGTCHSYYGLLYTGGGNGSWNLEWHRITQDLIRSVLVTRPEIANYWPSPKWPVDPGFGVLVFFTDRRLIHLTAANLEQNFAV